MVSVIFRDSLPLRDLDVERDYKISRYGVYFWYAIARLPFQIMAAYFLAYYVIPKYILKKKYVISLVLFSLSAYVLTVLLRILNVHLIEPLLRTPPFSKESILEIFMDIKHLFLQYFFGIYPTVLIFLVIKFYLDYKRQKEKSLALDKAKVEAELKTLKMQLNPHFLFNTLNNIYSLAVLKSERTPEAIARLSKILDYLLYECHKRYVPLIKEIHLVEDYIELEKLRYEERLKINFEKEIHSEDTLIAPLVIVSLVENAFKHGAGKDSGIPEIDLFITDKNNGIHFRIKNSISEPVDEKQQAVGLGNKILKNQLDLVYGNRYTLCWNIESQFYVVDLRIQLNTVSYED